jgi:indolepyruvate ferredoxin oxidoreductase beta subunit
MRFDVILSGVGGQGVLSVATIIAQAAVDEGLIVRQSEVHGMAQRGGAVLAHMRISDRPIAGDLVPRGNADIIISMEPLESLRHTAWLSPSGMLLTAAGPIVNITNYPELDSIYAAIKSFPRSKVIKAEALAKEAGLARAVNTVMVGAASYFLPLNVKTLENTIIQVFATKEPMVLIANKKAFELGRQAAKIEEGQ